MKTFHGIAPMPAEFKSGNDDSQKIKVLLVDDSPVALTILKRMLASCPEIEVVGTARNGQEALQLIPRLQPRVICTDYHMPVLNGLQFTREIMAKYPRPILVVSVSAEEGSANVFNLLEAGALDIFPKPFGGLEAHSPEIARNLIQKIKILAGVRVFRRALPPTAPRAAALPLPKPTALKSKVPLRLVVIGTSTGGPPALRTILSGLPASFSLPIVCVQHISEGFLPGLLEWLTSECRMRVRVAGAGEKPLPGIIYFPPEQHHLQFDQQGRFVTSQEPPVGGHRPSVSLTMRSAAASYGPEVLGILLTGMGKDGAEGLLDIARAGGITIAQDEASSVVFGMPKQAIELGAAKYVMSLTEVADALKKGIGTEEMGKSDYLNQKPGNPFRRSLYGSS
jgi:two-component system chemotaxis response regulator CheB